MEFGVFRVVVTLEDTKGQAERGVVGVVCVGGDGQTMLRSGAAEAPDRKTVAWQPTGGRVP